MSLTDRETFAALHGMIFGALFLLAFAGGFAGLYSLRPALLTAQGLVERSRRLIAGTWAMALVAWATVYTGTFIVYPWYRAKGATSPKNILLANVNTADWHNFGMEWKEHIAWLAPILATMVAVVVTYYGPSPDQAPGPPSGSAGHLRAGLRYCCGRGPVWRLHHEGRPSP